MRDVFRTLDIEITPQRTWFAGRLTRDYYKSLYGVLPPKELVRKTDGNGTHCMAVYPGSMRHQMEQFALIAATRYPVEPDDAA